MQPIRALDYIGRLFIFKSTIRKELKFHKGRVKYKANFDTIEDSIYYDLDIMDAKCAALLTHISIIVGCLVAFFSYAKGNNELRHVILLEIGMYGFVSLLLMRCLSIFTFTAAVHSNRSSLLIEYIHRKNYYTLSVNLITGLTVLIVIYAIKEFS